MRTIRVSDPDARDLVDAILARDAGMPVRALERILDRGEAGFGILMVAARESIGVHRRPGYAHWCAVALGECRDADAVPELTLLLRLASRAPAIDVGFSAAEAIGKIGPAGEEALLQNARLTHQTERFWLHYAAALLGTEGAVDFLLDELKRNSGLADSAAMALAVLGHADALPAIDRTLARAKSWQMPILSQAVLALHRNEQPIGTYTRNWRLRYRYHPGFGRFPSLLPCLHAMIRGDSRGRRAAADERDIPRSVDGIISTAYRPGQRSERACAACHSGRPRLRTGVVRCDACAPAAAKVQADCLLGVDCRSNDLFDVLDVIDRSLMDHDRRGLPETEEYRRTILAHAACHWLVERGIESAAAGVALLLVEAEQSAGHGTDDLPLAHAAMTSSDD